MIGTNSFACVTQKQQLFDQRKKWLPMLALCYNGMPIKALNLDPICVVRKKQKLFLQTTEQFIQMETNNCT